MCYDQSLNSPSYEIECSTKEPYRRELMPELGREVGSNVCKEGGTDWY